MIKLWTERTPREKLLIAIAGAIVLFIILLRLVVLPIVEARDVAQLRADRAARTLESLSRLPSVQDAGTPTSAGAQDPDAIRRAILETASSRGLTIARVLVDDEGRVIVQVDDAPAESVFDWLLDLRRSSDVQILRATINEAGNGFVRSGFEFAGANK